MKEQSSQQQNLINKESIPEEEAKKIFNLTQLASKKEINSLHSIQSTDEPNKQMATLIYQPIQSLNQLTKKNSQSTMKNLSERPLNEIKNINNVFFMQSTRTFYVPVYLRMVVKSIKHIDFQALQGSLNLTIILNVNTWGLPQQLVTFIQENITLGFNRNQSKNLKKQKIQPHFGKAQDIEKIKNAYKLDPKNPPKQNLKQGQKKKQEKSKDQVKDKGQKQQKKEKGEKKQKKQQKEKGGKKEDGKVKLGFKVTIRDIMNATLQPYVFFTPFELINLVVSIEVRDLKYNENSNEPYFVKFNIMSMKEELPLEQTQDQLPIRTKMLSDGGANDYGVYSVANKRMTVQYTNNAAHKTLMKLGKNFYNLPWLDIKRQETKKVQQAHSSESIKYGHFHIPLSRNPITVLTTLFIPLWLFSIINLAIFTLPPSLGGRIGAISTIMLAFVSLIPSIRQQIPTSPTLTIFQMLVYLQTVTSVLVLLQSLAVQNQDESAAYSFMRNYRPAMDERYNISFFITLIIIAIPVLMYLWYQVYLRQSHYFKKGAKGQKNDKTFENWTQSVGNTQFNLKNQKDLIFNSQELQKYKLPQIEKGSFKMISAVSLTTLPYENEIKQMPTSLLKIKSG